jgi:hypothetical protein
MFTLWQLEYIIIKCDSKAERRGKKVIGALETEEETYCCIDL